MSDNLVTLVQAIAWPVVVILIFLLTPLGRRLIDTVSRRVTRVKGYGIEVELSPEKAAELRDNLQDVFTEYRTKMKAKFDQLVLAYNIREHIKTITMQCLTEDQKKDYRCTVHVPDVLFEDGMYQLIDYYPKGMGAGRSFSIRFGMVGKAWRLGKSQIQGNIDPMPANLIESWGMKREEAEAAKGDRRSIACIILHFNNVDVGVLYLDAAGERVFGANSDEEEKFIGQLEESARDTGLSASIAEACEKMRLNGPALKIFDPRG